MRYKAVSCMSRSYRPTVPVSYIAKVLGFTSDSVEIDECVEWLKAHGACLITDNGGEMQLDAKVVFPFISEFYPEVELFV